MNSEITQPPSAHSGGYGGSGSAWPELLQISMTNRLHWVQNAVAFADGVPPEQR